MQPLYLEMQAYGPYVDKTVIDFNELPNNLTLISGNTGAGKTTIFDAICCALFGESSGRDRSFKQMRSDFSSDGTPTKINFKFRIKDQDYEILRYAPYERRKRNSEETTFVNAKAELVLPDKTVITGVKNVNEKINDILGIGQDEFRQIVMIAQNDFMAMIKEAGKKQERIFNRIFNAKLYENFSRKILEKNRTYKQKVSEEANRIIAALDNTEIEYDSLLINPEDINTVKLKELVDKVEAQTNTEYKSVDKKLRKLKAIFQDEQIKRENAKKLIEDFTLRDEATKNLKSLEIKAPEITELITRKDLAVKARDTVEAPYLAYIKAQRTLEDLRRSLERKRKEEETKEDLYHEQERKLSEFSQDKLNKLYSNYKNILEDLPQYQELSRLTEELTQNSKKEEELQEKQTKLQDDLKLKEKEASSIEIKPDEFFKAQDEKLKLSKEALERDKEIILNFNNNTALIVQTLKNLKEMRINLHNLRDHYNESKEAYDNAFRDYINNQAAFLAENLKEGEPCPVCGSKDHPKLAVLKSPNVTQETLDNLKLRQEADDKALRDGINSYNMLKTDYNFKLNNLIQNFKELSNLEPEEEEILKAFLEKLKITQDILEEDKEFIAIGSLKTLSEIIKTLINRVGTGLDKTQEEIKINQRDLQVNNLEKTRAEKLNSEIEDFKKTQTQLEEALRVTREKVITIKAKKSSLEEKCIYSNLEQAQRECNKQKALYTNYDKNFKEARINLEHASKSLESVKGEIKTLTKQIEESSEESESLKTDYLTSLKVGGFETEEEFLKRRLAPDKLKAISQEIDSYNNQTLTLETKIQELNKRLENSATRF